LYASPHIRRDHAAHPPQSSPQTWPHTIPAQEGQGPVCFSQNDLCYAAQNLPVSGLPVDYFELELCMSVETSNRVWKYSQKGGAPLLLLLAMADWSDDWGYCYPRLEQMAAKCRQSERNIITLIGELEQVGEVRRVARGKGGRGKFSGSVYQVTVGLSEAEIAAAERVSPLAREVLAKLQSGEIGLPVSRKPAVETGEKISPEKQEPNFSPVSVVRLNELINVSDNTPPPAEPQKSDWTTEDRAEALYRLVRPTHLTLPNSEQRTVALKVL
jgi:hypothetical protein